MSLELPLSHKILVVDDSPEILELLHYNLTKAGYEVRTTTQPRKATEIALNFRPDLIILDIMMPEQDGVETCRQLRSKPLLNDTHILMLTARSEEFSEIAAFEVGADDFINKPIKPRALLSRIASALRKVVINRKEDMLVNTPSFQIDKTTFSVIREGELINFPKKEFELLVYLAQNPNRVFSREELLRSIWGSDVFVLARTVDVHVRKLREKLGFEYIHTVKGVGYRFQYPE